MAPRAASKYHNAHRVLQQQRVQAGEEHPRKSGCYVVLCVGAGAQQFQPQELLKCLTKEAEPCGVEAKSDCANVRISRSIQPTFLCQDFPCTHDVNFATL
jgi:hypothetical protein